MKKLITLTLITAFAVATPALAIGFGSLALAADSSEQTDQQDVQSDRGAIRKDNQALGNDENNLQNNRDAKAADKANGNYCKQAVDSTKIGANHAAIGEKKMEKHADKKILHHHKKELREDKAETQGSGNSGTY